MTTDALKKELEIHIAKLLQRRPDAQARLLELREHVKQAEYNLAHIDGEIATGKATLGSIQAADEGEKAGAAVNKASSEVAKKLAKEAKNK